MRRRPLAGKAAATGAALALAVTGVVLMGQASNGAGAPSAAARHASPLSSGSSMSSMKGMSGSGRSATLLSTAGDTAQDRALGAADPQPSTAMITIEGCGSFCWQFVDSSSGTNTTELAPGGTLSVFNDSTTRHTFTSVAVDSTGTKKAFDVNVNPGATVSIPVSSLPDGVYHYYCAIHPSMAGTLTIGTGGPVSTVPTFGQPLYQPPRKTGRRIAITMKQAPVQIMPSGPATTMWTYGGTFPGPTIVRPTGADTKVTFTNDLPVSAGAVTVHQHSGHQASKYDGQPASYLIRHGRSMTYDYPLRDGGSPLPAALRFYHDHRMNETARNNWYGLAGMFLTTDAKDAARGLPTGQFDIPLMVNDIALDGNNQIVSPFGASPMAGMAMSRGASGASKRSASPPQGTVGNIVLVNGRFAPYQQVQPALYRLQIVNTSLFSSYDFALTNGEPFLQVGTGDGLLPHPVTRHDILLGPGQRADVVVDFRTYGGENVMLQSIPREDPRPAGSVDSIPAVLMEFQVQPTAVPTQKPVSSNLLTLRKMRVPSKVGMTWNFGVTRSHWTINGKRYDPRRVDHKVKLGTTQRWVLRNTSSITHYVHLHEELWRTIKRDGGTPPPWEQGYEDTWRLDPGESVVVAATFTDFTGKFMVHCHMLDHEDDGMMATFEVVR